MSSPGRDGPGEDRSQSLTKFIRRASKVLRPKSNRNSVISQSDVVGGSSSMEGGGGAVVAQVQPKTTPASAGQSKPAMSSMAHMKEREDKARALFAKYGLKLEPGEWTPPRSDTQWVEKKVVMRVHRHCHRCQTAFGSDKTCGNCNHTRCKKCPRVPTKRPKEQRGKEATVAAVAGAGAATAAGAVAVEAARQPRSKIQLTMPSRFNQDLVRRDPVQRVRRTCHRCDVLFTGRATECEGCKHQRCPKCPRDPPKAKKYPDGYPGDVEETFPLAQRTYRPARLRCRWECHGCKAFFMQGEKKCRGCEHERCDQCQRHPPKKVKPPPNPDVIKSLEEKLGKMMVSSATAA